MSLPRNASELITLHNIELLTNVSIYTSFLFGSSLIGCFSNSPVSRAGAGPGSDGGRDQGSERPVAELTLWTDRAHLLPLQLKTNPAWRLTGVTPGPTLTLSSLSSCPRREATPAPVHTSDELGIKPHTQTALSARKLKSSLLARNPCTDLCPTQLGRKMLGGTLCQCETSESFLMDRDDSKPHKSSHRDRCRKSLSLWLQLLTNGNSSFQTQH